MSTLKIGSQYRESPMLIVPSAAGFPLVFKPTRTRGRCELSTALGLAATVAALFMATVSFAGTAGAGSDYQISAGAGCYLNEIPLNCCGRV
jgi:hypothetical protein